MQRQQDDAPREPVKSAVSCNSVAVQMAFCSHFLHVGKEKRISLFDLNRHHFYLLADLSLSVQCTECQTVTKPHQYE